MRISELILFLEAQKDEHGDIDVVCVTPGCGSDFESTGDIVSAAMVCKTEDLDREINNTETDKYLYLGIDG